jgi:cytochrome b subunit of formate dehydrogenase
MDVKDQRGQSGMNFKRWPRTDVGTVLLHWVVVVSVVVLAGTGLRFASDDLEFRVLRGLDPYLPQNNLWLYHIAAGYVLTISIVAYTSYISKARLADRTRLNAARLQSLVGTAKARWSAINALMVWVFFVAALSACVTGWLAYFGVDGPVLQIHLLCTWVILAFPVLHILGLLRLGGIPHLVRIFRPKRAEAAAEDLDLANVVADLLAERRAARQRASGKPDASN